MSYLVVVAHPDDEILGAGATIAKLTEQGKEVNVCILSGEAEARANKPSDKGLDFDMQSATKYLGVHKIIKGKFPNIEFNTVPHLAMVQFIENAIIQTGADVLFTHHPSDLNNDHLCTSTACQVASRLSMRRSDVKPIRELLFMEVLSATDWSFNTVSPAFKPNTYYHVGERLIDKKIEALSKYYGVMREFPHSRSAETIKALSVIRGSQCGVAYAEAFESVYKSV
ncbi:MAG: 1D-myo-inositol 2-acetamido-2-deoxy-alpha-D-glucopyranoside deacetylase [Firmicutes bacterium ADurb.Bin193]|nr:MAG: 1D-myo-inositol 2-acetamido-2-deoxy-alpha-D-glucopyranoside deacetylase [Firmicutes bacterium ADurb.Bin193]